MTDNKVIFNGLTYKLVLDEPEPVAEWKPIPGLYYEFSDDSDFPACKIGKFTGISANKTYPFGTEYANWRFCRPLQDPNLIQMIPWEGGECPVPGDTRVLVKTRDGAMLDSRAKDLRWSHADLGSDIVKYAVLK